MFVFITARLQAPHLFHNYNDVEEWNRKLQTATATTPTPPVIVLPVPHEEPEPEVIVPPEPTENSLIPEPSKAEPQGAVANQSTPKPNNVQQEMESLLTKRQEAVRNALLHAWEGYEHLAFGHDELRPTTNITNDSWNGYKKIFFLKKGGEGLFKK